MTAALRRALTSVLALHDRWEDSHFIPPVQPQRMPCAGRSDRSNSHRQRGALRRSPGLVPKLPPEALCQPETGGAGLGRAPAGTGGARRCSQVSFLVREAAAPDSSPFPSSTFQSRPWAKRCDILEAEGPHQEPGSYFLRAGRNRCAPRKPRRPLGGALSHPRRWDSEERTHTQSRPAVAWFLRAVGSRPRQTAHIQVHSPPP